MPTSRGAASLTSRSDYLTARRSVRGTAQRLYRALRPLHGLRAADEELLSRSEAALTFMCVARPFDLDDLLLLRSGLADLPATDSHVVESAASFATDRVLHATNDAWSGLCASDKRRALWLAALMRAARQIDGRSAGPESGLWTSWTESVLYLEVDAPLAVTPRAQPDSGTAMLETLVGRSVVIASSTQRWECRRAPRALRSS